MKPHRPFEMLLTISTIFVALGVATNRASAAGKMCTKNNGENGMTCKTSRLQVEILNGAIVSAKDLRTQEVHANRALNDVKIPRGMGSFYGDPNGTASPTGAASVHNPWGTDSIYAENNYFHHPYPASQFTFGSTATSCTAIWTGLTNGSFNFPFETMRVDLSIGPGGELLYRTTVGTSCPTPPDPNCSVRNGVYGALMPIANLASNHRIYVPSFGGVMYDTSSFPSPQIRTLDRAPFWEAPVVAAESPTGSLGAWITDPTFRPNSFFLSWTGTSFGFGIEQDNLLPMDSNTSFSGVEVHLDVFLGGWVDAMTPYKSWYASEFANELAVRASPAWANDIRVIVDQYMQPEENYLNPDPAASYQDLASSFGANRVLFHEWQARQEEQDTFMPDYTPRKICNSDSWAEGLGVKYGFRCTANSDCTAPGHPNGMCIDAYPTRANLLEEQGFHTMGYVNSYVVNFHSPAFNQKNMSINTIPHRFDWFDSYIRPVPDYSPNTPDLTVIKVDPLSSWWRDDHIQRMLTWRNQTGLDANYEDSAGDAGDFGNGVVDNGPLGMLSAAQGSVQLFRDVQYLGVPMATEYGTDAVAFASRWPQRNYYATWGDEAFRTWLSTHQRPVNSYLFGPGQAAWVPTLYAWSNKQHHGLAAMSDALGSVASFRSDRWAYTSSAGDLRAMKDHAKLFASLQLKPMFDPARGPDTLASLYQDSSGNRYSYYSDNLEQKLVAPNGACKYARITGVTSKESAGTGLWIRGWPGNGTPTRSTIVGLEPTAHYNLTSDYPEKSAIQIDTLPTANVKVAKYYDTPTHVVLVLRALDGISNPPTKVTVSLHTQVEVRNVILNDALVQVPVWNAQTQQSSTVQYPMVSLPAYFVFTKLDGVVPGTDVPIGGPTDRGHFIEKETGIDRREDGDVALFGNTEIVIQQSPSLTLPAFFPALGENAPHTFDYLIRPQSASPMLQIYSCAEGNESQGVIYINGREVRRFIGVNGCWSGGGMPPEQLDYDLSSFVGRDVLISIAFDHGTNNDTNADRRYFSRPRLVPVI